MADGGKPGGPRTPRSGLGRGLSALLPEAEAPGAPRVSELAVGELRANPYQPRQTFDEAKLDELAASLARHGMMQPVTVRSAPDGRGYEVVAGERRWRAAQRAGLTTVPVMVVTAGDREMLEMALVENLQREDLNAIEAAEAYRRCMEEFGLTQEQLAEQVGKSRTAVANTLRLLRLAPEVRTMVIDGRLTEGHARAVLALVDETEQVSVARRIVADGLTVREAEELARERRARPSRRRADEPGEFVPMDPELAAFAERLQRALGTRVEVHLSPNGSGSLVIRFYTPEDLTRIAERLAP